MIPHFSPARAAYRLDSIANKVEYTNGSDAVSNWFQWAPDGLTLYHARSASTSATLYSRVYYSTTAAPFDVSGLTPGGFQNFQVRTSGGTVPGFISAQYYNGGDSLAALIRLPGGEPRFLRYDSLDPDYIPSVNKLFDYQDDDPDPPNILGLARGGFLFTGDGLTVYVANNQEIFRTSLSTAYDFSTRGTFTSVKNVTAEFGTEDVRAMCWGRSENVLLLCEDKIVREYTLGVAGDVSTATFSTSYDLSAELTFTSDRISEMRFFNRGRQFGVTYGGRFVAWDSTA